MHELSIVIDIVDIARRELQKSKAGRIDSIELEIGKLAGVEPMALEFAWPEATRNTVLEHAEKKIIYVSGLAECHGCHHRYELAHFYDECPQCQSYLKDIIQGRELRVKALILS